jgi:serine/threonine protein phosphatase 1
MNWIIGDIHGMLGPLRALVDAINAHDPKAQFIFAGDYVNRGTESKGVLDYLPTLKNARFLRGNHDDVFDFLLSGKSVVADIPDDPCTVFFWFLDQGLDRTLLSYGIEFAQLERLARRCSARLLRQMLRVVPHEHCDFLRELPLVIEEDEFFVAHGYVDPESPAEKGFAAAQLWDDEFRRQTLWNRPTEEQIAQPKKWTRVGYFGHTPVSNFDPPLFMGRMVPLRGNKMVMLDTAVGVNPEGRLSAICHETGLILQSDRDGKIIRPDDGPPEPDTPAEPIEPAESAS